MPIYFIRLGGLLLVPCLLLDRSPGLCISTPQTLLNQATGISAFNIPFAKEALSSRPESIKRALPARLTFSRQLKEKELAKGISGASQGAADGHNDGGKKSRRKKQKMKKAQPKNQQSPHSQRNRRTFIGAAAAALIGGGVLWHELTKPALLELNTEGEMKAYITNQIDALISLLARSLDPIDNSWIEALHYYRTRVTLFDSSGPGIAYQNSPIDPEGRHQVDAKTGFPVSTLGFSREILKQMVGHDKEIVDWVIRSFLIKEAGGLIYTRSNLSASVSMIKTERESKELIDDAGNQFGGADILSLLKNNASFKKHIQDLVKYWTRLEGAGYIAQARLWKSTPGIIEKIENIIPTLSAEPALQSVFNSVVVFYHVVASNPDDLLWAVGMRHIVGYLDSPRQPVPFDIHSQQDVYRAAAMIEYYEGRAGIAANGDADLRADSLTGLPPRNVMTYIRDQSFAPFHKANNKPGLEWFYPPLGSRRSLLAAFVSMYWRFFDGHELHLRSSSFAEAA